MLTSEQTIKAIGDWQKTHTSNLITSQISYQADTLASLHADKPTRFKNRQEATKLTS